MLKQRSETNGRLDRTGKTGYKYLWQGSTVADFSGEFPNREPPDREPCHTDALVDDA